MRVTELCDSTTEFQCNLKQLKCIPRSSVNNGIQDCENGSDENVVNFVCFEYEFSCMFKKLKQSSKVMEYNRCLSYDMLRDGKTDCSSNVDEKHYTDNCTHENLFLCLDQSRCLPKNMVCNQVINCIDGSDEIERCKYPIFFRQYKSNRTFLKRWLFYYFKTSGEQFFKVIVLDAKSMLNKVKTFLRESMYGLKCKTFYRTHSSYTTTSKELKSLYQTVPQPNISFSKTYCINHEDNCFDKLGKLRCFRCFDGTIVLKKQVCNGMIDCQDLSDECTCEHSKVKPLCELMYKSVDTKTKQRLLEKSCDVEIDFPGGDDEKYCSYKILFTDETESVSNCAKGKSALNRRLYVPPKNKDNVDPFFVWLIRGKFQVTEVRLFPVYQQKTLNSLSDLNGSCNGIFECPFREDECSQDCLNQNYRQTNSIFNLIFCFSFFFQNLKPFSVMRYPESGVKSSQYYFNNSVLHEVSPSYYLKEPYQTITRIKGGMLFSNKLQNKSFRYTSNHNMMEECSKNLLDCPWYFRCEYDTLKLIDIKKVCDLNYDCKDQSDEKYCSTKTHFNCTTGSPVSVDRNKVNDNELDCTDRSDECKESPISSVKEMIKNIYLRKFIWVTFIGIIISNLLVITMTLKKIKSFQGNSCNKYFNLILITNLSFSDIIYGFVLVFITLKSNEFSGKYCSIDFDWRSSFSCEIVGMLTVISSQTSLNILVLMTGFRLYTIYKPFKSLESSKRNIFILLTVCWIISLVLSIIPIIFEKEFTQSVIISNNMFLENKKVDRIIKPNELYILAQNIENVWTDSKPSSSIPSSKSIYKIRDFKEWYFNSENMKNQYPGTSIEVKNVFGFYSSSAVCLPDFYSKSKLSSQFSIILISYNFFLITCISAGYILLYYRIRFTKVEKKSKNSSKKENTLLYRISLIIATDIACWLPIIVYSYSSFFGYPVPDSVHSLTSLVLLPINSFINPIIYSKIDVILIKKIKKSVSMLQFSKN